MRFLLSAALLVTISPLVQARGEMVPPVLPDNIATPGDYAPGVGKAELCPTEKVKRPPITAAMRRQIFKNYPGMESYCADHPCELDHRYPFGLGGATNAKNIWPQAKDTHPGALDKDRMEALAHTRWCEGSWTLKQARSQFDDWLASFDRLYGRD